MSDGPPFIAHGRQPFMDDGVEYQAVDCVRCHGTVVVATAALLVADRKSWPLCSECWRGLEADEDAHERETAWKRHG